MSKKLIITNEDIRRKSGCADCMANKLLFDEVMHKSEWDIIVSQFLIN